MTSFTARDFETAQGYRWIICQVGLVRVVNGQITNKLELLVQPPDNHYWCRFTEIHGITSEMTENALTFDKVWHLIELSIRNQNVVAHNGHAFDFPCLQQTLDYYGIEMPEFYPHCTYRLFGDGLARYVRNIRSN